MTGATFRLTLNRATTSDPQGNGVDKPLKVTHHGNTAKKPIRGR